MDNHFSEEETCLSVTNPAKEASRLFSIDVLRGIALLGILLISIWEFGGFSNNEQTRLRLLEKGNNYHLFTSLIILFEGKMRAILSLVFGASMMLYMQKPQQLSLPTTQELFIRRQMLLIAFGLINAFVLLWPGDMLFQYGIVGILLFPFFRMKRKGLLIAAIIVTLIYCGKNYWFYADDNTTYTKYKAITLVEEKFKKDSTKRHQTDSLAGMSKIELAKKDSIAKKKDTLNTIQQREKSAWEGMIKGLKYDSTNAATIGDNKAMSAGYTKIWNHLLNRSQNKEASWLYRVGIWDIGSMVLLGMALFGFGFFNNDFSKTKYLLIAIIGIAIGFALAWYRISLQHSKLLDYVKYINSKPFAPNQFVPIERLSMALGYVSLAMLLLRTKIFKSLLHPIAAVGRLAFTNYFMQTIVCTLFFYGYGFGYFGRLSLVQLYLFVAEVWLVQIVFSIFWLRYFEYGPLEWLWRCLIKGKRFSNKKQIV